MKSERQSTDCANTSISLTLHEATFWERHLKIPCKFDSFDFSQPKMCRIGGQKLDNSSAKLKLVAKRNKKSPPSTLSPLRRGDCFDITAYNIELITSSPLLSRRELENYQQKRFVPICIVYIRIIHAWPSLPIGMVYWIPMVERAEGNVGQFLQPDFHPVMEQTH